jgi:antitoxin component of RelBE/YafQ-DinJ toxin-antitoxin module
MTIGAKAQAGAYTVNSMTKPLPPKDRPPAKDKVVSVRVPDEIFDAATAKAKERGLSISKVVRSFLFLFAHDETPPGWPPELPEQEVRAEERPRKKRRK